MLPLRARVAIVALSLFAVVACTVPTSPFTPPPGSGDAKPADDAAKCVNSFAVDLYAHLRTQKGNLIVSPYSINTALAMAASGAEGSTREEMQRVLHLPDAEKLGPAFHTMTTSVTTVPLVAKHKPELSVANSLWIQKNHPVKKEYLARARDDFRAGLFEADFERDAEGARGRINRWVERETRDRIKDLIPQGGVDGGTQMVLANAIYFKAHWAEEFKKRDTKPDDFTLASGQKVQTPLMYQQNKFWLEEREGFQILRMSYQGQAAMYVILPRKHDGLPAVEKQLNAQNFWEWTLNNGKPPQTEVKVWIPRFKFTVPTELGATLQKMGLREAFDPQKANFKGMTDHPRGLYISRVIHKAFVETDEVGTEAAAATAVTMALGAAAPNQLPPPIPVFRADHPFLFVIKHEDTGAVLFLGRVEDPTRKE